MRKTEIKGTHGKEIKLDGFAGDGFDGMTILNISIINPQTKKETTISLYPKQVVELKDFLQKYLNDVGKVEGYRIFI